MALSAIGLSVGARQRKARQRIMIEARVLPLIDRVACLALERYARRRMVKASRAGVVLLVAGYALGAESGVGSGGGSGVARCALHRRMCPHQRKAIAVLANLANGLVPTLHRVAVLAACAKLIAVDIGVAISALDAHIRKRQAAVTVIAAHILVHAAQWVRGLSIVVELGNGANRPPAARRVTVLARNVE